jgi:hypothetical protein
MYNKRRRGRAAGSGTKTNETSGEQDWDSVGELVTTVSGAPVA